MQSIDKYIDSVDSSDVIYVAPGNRIGPRGENNIFGITSSKGMKTDVITLNPHTDSLLIPVNKYRLISSVMLDFTVNCKDKKSFGTKVVPFITKDADGRDLRFNTTILIDSINRRKGYGKRNCYIENLNDRFTSVDFYTGTTNEMFLSLDSLKKYIYSGDIVCTIKYNDTISSFSSDNIICPDSSGSFFRISSYLPGASITLDDTKYKYCDYSMTYSRPLLVGNNYVFVNSSDMHIIINKIIDTTCGNFKSHSDSARGKPVWYGYSEYSVEVEYNGSEISCVFFSIEYKKRTRYYVYLYSNSSNICSPDEIPITKYNYNSYKIKSDTLEYTNVGPDLGTYVHFRIPDKCCDEDNDYCDWRPIERGVYDFNEIKKAKSGFGKELVEMIGRTLDESGKSDIMEEIGIKKVPLYTYTFE